MGKRKKTLVVLLLTFTISGLIFYALKLYLLAAIFAVMEGIFAILLILAEIRKLNQESQLLEDEYNEKKWQ